MWDVGECWVVWVLPAVLVRWASVARCLGLVADGEVAVVWALWDAVVCPFPLAVVVFVPLG